ncbi:alkaline shock response membrane anchor protein AmaP [Streptomyces albipurpureus]|uniref:Alkaline shock response membrane anchor protein AmaP n=1 Tax=Streptomyces albipurpureus TaxID=2897419 RepID=A0ABT0UT29_9ACTN|nr:alkaline shock response membrane anchor protein AmaP [Streptomyces sp. CWNU-1]MCM2391546.1 alkaline shock response membrane anchor protein AmaP [Streptomyces sp. CWNU-1]
MLRTVNRVLLALAGLVLLCLGGGVLAAGAGLDVPSWWPWDGRRDVLLSVADRERWRDEGWWWPSIIAGLAVLVLLALWWFCAQLRRSRLTEILVDSGDGEGSQLRGRALEGAIESEAESLDGVSRARVRLSGRRDQPTARVRLLLEPYASPAVTVARLASEAVAHGRDSAGLAALPAEARLKAAKHGATRVT